MAQPLSTPGKDPVSIVQEAGWATGPVWTDAENLAFTGIRCPGHPACTQSLYRLSYPAHIFISLSEDKLILCFSASAMCLQKQIAKQQIKK
jgi:hypothetical protein